MKRLIKTMTIILMSLGMLSACGGGSSVAPTPVAAVNLTGTAAAGLPINGFIFVIDANGVEINVATQANGSFSLNTAGMTPPLMLRVVPNNGSATLYSYASALAQTVNLTPLTSLALFIANAQADLAATYAAWNGVAITAANITNAQMIVNANFSARMTAAGIDPLTYDFLSTAFSANGVGIDGMLDLLLFTFNYIVGNFNITAGGVPVAFNPNISTAGIAIGGGGGTGGGTGAPAVTGMTPTSGAVGATVTITGTNFTSANFPATSVTFSGNVQATGADLVSVTTTQIVVNVPAGAQSGPISIQQIPGGPAVNTAAFTVNGAAAPQPIVCNQTTSVCTPTGTLTVTGAGISITGASFPVAGSTVLGQAPIIPSGGNTLVWSIGTPQNRKTLTVSPSIATGGYVVTLLINSITLTFPPVIAISTFTSAASGAAPNIIENANRTLTFNNVLLSDVTPGGPSVTINGILGF